MSTITTKQLRQNMNQVINELRETGKPVKLSYRHRVIGILQPVGADPAPLRRGSAKAVHNFLESANFGRVPADLRNPRISAKQQLAELRKLDLEK